MNREEFVNKIAASCTHIDRREIDAYFANYTGPTDRTTAQEYIRRFMQNPGDVPQQMDRVSHENAIIENGLLGINNPLRPRSGS